MAGGRGVRPALLRASALGAAIAAAAVGVSAGAGAAPAGSDAAQVAPGGSVQRSGSCVWTVAALPQLPGSDFGEVRGTDGADTFVGISGNRPVRWRHGQVTELAPTGFATDVNRRGHAVGDDGRHAVLWIGTTQVRLAEPAGMETSQATGINDAGLIVGYGSGGNGGAQGLVWSARHPDQVRVLGGGTGDQSLFLRGVNELGVIAGTVVDSSLNEQALVGTVRSGLRPLRPATAGFGTRAEGIAGRYVVGGESNFATGDGNNLLWRGGRPRVLPGPGSPTAVNRRGVAVGIDFTDFTAVVWQHGVQVRLPGLAPGLPSAALAVTDRGQVAGSAHGPDGTGGSSSQPAVWTCR